MFVRYRDISHTSRCTVITNQRMECRSPIIPIQGQLIPPEDPLNLDFGFTMDDVPSVQNLSKGSGFSFLLYPDPVYEKFDEEVKYYKSDYLTINGANLDRACQVTTVSKDNTCNVLV